MFNAVVTVVAVAPGSVWYCVGHEEGAVDLFDTRTGDAIELSRISNFLSVNQMIWSQDATHDVAADLEKNVFVKRVIT